jgi:hypothetical protein
MSIGLVKFFYKNKIDMNATFSFTSAPTILAKYLYDNTLETWLTSIGSNDATPEVWEITFNTSKNVNRIHMPLHNIKSGTLKYWNGSAWTNFSPAISWTANTATSNYYEFTKVAAEKLQLTMNTTITVNDQKRVSQLRAFEEIGTVQKNPSSIQQSFPANSRMVQKDDAKIDFVYFGERYSGTYSFDSVDSTDESLIRGLRNLRDPFYVYPCGGIPQTEEGYRLEDMYLVSYVNNYSTELKANLYGVGLRITMQMEGS